MRKRLAAILVALSLVLNPLTFIPSAFAEIDYRSLIEDDTQGVQVPIPMNCRVFNKSGSQCVWASISCLSLYLKIEPTSHLTDKYKHATGPGEVRQVLDSLGVKYQMQENRDTKMLEDACAKGWGAGVGLSGTHMVNVVHFKGDVVKIIDNSDSTLQIRTWTKDQFLKRFDGWCVVMIPTNNPSKAPSNDNVPLPPRPPSSVN